MTINSNDTAADDGYDSDEPRVKVAPMGVRLLIALLGRWYWIALATLIGGGCSTYYLSKAPKIYTASSSILVKEQTGSLIGRDQTEEINMGSLVAMNTVIEQLKRQTLLEAVAERDEVRALTGVMPPKVRWLPPWVSDWIGDKHDDNALITTASIPRGEFAGMIASCTTVSMRGVTRLLDIRVSHTSPEVAKVLADAIALEFIAQTTGDKSSGRSSVIELLTEKSEGARQSLQESQKSFSAYQRALAGHEELQVKEKEVVELTRRYRAKHPELINAMAQLANLQNRFLMDFTAAVQSGADAAYWKEKDVSLESGGQELSERLEVARRMLLSRTSILKNEIQSQETVFNAMLTKIREADVNQAEQGSAIEMNSRAHLPGTAVSPVEAKVISTGLIGGFLVGAAFALLLIRMDNKFHTVMQVEEILGVPVLAAVSIIQPQAKPKKSAEAVDPKELEALELEKNWDPKIVFRHGLADSGHSEMFRVLRASITLLGPEEKRKVTLFTSAIPGEGKTTTAVNFALAAAGQGKRVLLVDLDLRRPAVHAAFGIPRDSDSRGVTGYLSGQRSFDDSILTNVSGTGLDLMVSGVKAPRPGELLNGFLLNSLLAEARARYDLIVLDTAPLLAVPDTRVIAPHADNVCMVVRAEYVPKGAVLRVLSLLEAGRTPLAGIVLNAFRARRSLIAYNYTYGYYKYGSSGNPYGDGRDAYGADEK